MPPKKVVEEVDPAKLAAQRRRQEVLLTARLQSLLHEEQSMSRANLAKIQCRWLEFLRAQKHQELTGDIDIVRHTFEKTLDRKNAVIQMAQLDLEESEEQQRLALRTHLGNLDAISEMQHRRLAALDDRFESDLLALRREFELERAEVQRRHELEKADLRLVLDNMRGDAEREDRRLQEETGESHDMAVEKMDEDKKQMQGELMKMHEHLKQAISQHYSSFNSTAELHMKDYTDLTRLDEKSAREIEGQMRKIAKLQEAIATWKGNLNNNIKECEERNRAMRAEKEAIASHFKALKQRMATWRVAEERRLAELVTAARETKKALQSKGKVAERILRQVELCRGLETEREKVLGFSGDATSQQVVADVQRRVREYVGEHGGEAGEMVVGAEGNVSLGPGHTVDRSAAADALKEQLEADADVAAAAAEEWRLMERFWLKHNKVVLDAAAIAQEKFHLANENGKLRSLLKQYLDGISVTDEVMQKANNLLQATAIRGTDTLLETRGVSQGVDPSGRGVPVLEGKKMVQEVVKQRTF